MTSPVPQQHMEARLDRVELMLAEILDKMARVETMTVQVIEEVKPTIDELMKSNFVKMLGLGKKK
jgi:hypothetical protein